MVYDGKNVKREKKKNKKNRYNNNNNWKLRWGVCLEGNVLKTRLRNWHAPTNVLKIKVEEIILKKYIVTEIIHYSKMRVV